MNFRLSDVTIILVFSSLLFLSLPPAVTAQGKEDNPFLRDHSRPPVLVGATAILGWNNHTGELGPGDSPLCLPVENGSDWGFGVGLSAAWMSGVSGWGFLYRLTYEQRPGGSFVDRGPQPLPPPDPEHPVPQVSWSELSYTLLNAEMLFRQEVGSAGNFRLALAAGPAVQYMLGGHVRQGYAMAGEEGICFDGEIPDRNAFRFSLKGGVRGELPLFGSQWVITPGIYYDYALTDVSSLESWRVHSLLFQVDVWLPVW